jgi:transposase
MTRAEMESRRLQAVADLKDGARIGVTARRYNVSRMTVHRWRKAIARGEDLKARKAPGRPCRLTPGQWLLVKLTYQRDPRMAGVDLERWRIREFRDVILNRTGVEFSVDHVGRIMHALGWPKRARRRVGMPEST